MGETNESAKNCHFDFDTAAELDTVRIDGRLYSVREVVRRVREVRERHKQANTDE